MTLSHWKDSAFISSADLTCHAQRGAASLSRAAVSFLSMHPGSSPLYCPQINLVEDEQMKISRAEQAIQNAFRSGQQAYC